jgi:uncharacterized protein YqjF (DUF2071 family)
VHDSPVSAGFLGTSLRQARVLTHAEHRPWPVPGGSWLGAQTWVELAFLHWRVDSSTLRRRLPPGVELDLHHGGAWLGIVPFRMTNVRLRGLPPLPVLSTFPELNVRTYVTRDGVPGVWFCSLDADSRVFVEAAKRVYRLPYKHARMRCERHGDWVRYSSRRAGAAFDARYRGRGQLFHAEPGSLEEFLVERYCLYTAGGGRLFRAEIHHPPWDLQRGDVEIAVNTMPVVDLPDGEPHVLFVPRQDMVVWPLSEIR